MSVLPIGPPAAATARIDALEQFACARFAKVSAAAVRCRERSDSEAIHDLRVAARRLESALDVWRSALRPRPRRRARRLLRTLRRGAGRAREREVCAALLAARCEAASAAERPALETLLAELLRPVARDRERVARLVSEGRLARVERRLQRALRAGDERADPQRAAATARARLERRRHDALERLVVARASLDDAQLHEARIAVKKWRYAEESFAAIAGEPAVPARGLRELQRLLGAVHDAAVLRDLLLVRAENRAVGGDGAAAAALAALAVTVEQERRTELVRLRERGLESPGN